jgi:hypothetical protein
MRKLLLLLPLFFVGCTNEQSRVQIHMKARGVKSGNIYNITLTQPTTDGKDHDETEFVLLQDN